jgi:hypothetical protein
MARESQYTDGYLAETDGGHLITPGTYLGYHLRGKAKSWLGRYHGALIRSLVSRGCERVRSIGGMAAYVTRKTE